MVRPKTDRRRGSLSLHGPFVSGQPTEAAAAAYGLRNPNDGHLSKLCGCSWRAQVNEAVIIPRSPSLKKDDDEGAAMEAPVQDPPPTTVCSKSRATYCPLNPATRLIELPTA